MIPLRTDAPVRRLPLCNYILIGLNVVVFVLIAVMDEQQTESFRRPLILWPLAPTLSQFFTYQFLHGDIMHLAGNMLFLWIFGNSVNSRIGDAAYGLFYLACGVLAGIGFTWSGGANPCLGASGAIAGITMAYLVLFPRSEITIFYWFFFIGTINIQAIWLILGKIVLWDNVVAMSLPAAKYTNVAYSAHLVGYTVGFILTLLMLWLRVVPRDQFDLPAIWRRAWQRRAYAHMMSDPSTRAQAAYGRVARPVAADGTPIPLARPADPAGQLKDAVAHAMHIAEYDTAAQRYEELVALDPNAILSRDNQMALANHFMTQQRYPQAAAAYERYLGRYGKATDADQVKLLLGIIYGRYLSQFSLAQRYLTEALEHLTNPQHRAQATHWLEVATQGLQSSTPGPAPTT